MNACHFLLASNRPCHAPALHNREYCRHHTPDALAARRSRLDDLYSDNPPASVPEPTRTPEEIDASHLRAYWRVHHRVIAESTDDEQCQQIYDMILLALSEHAISPRSAGRLLQVVMDRRKVLAEQARQAAFRLMEERVRIHRRQTNAGEAADPQPLIESLADIARYLSPLPTGAPAPPDAELLEALTTTAFAPPPPGSSAQQPLGGLKIYTPGQ